MHSASLRSSTTHLFCCLFLFQASKDPTVVEKILADLDENKDGEVDFQEFVVLVAALTVACNEFFMDCHKTCMKQAPKKA